MTRTHTNIVIEEKLIYNNMYNNSWKSPTEITNWKLYVNWAFNNFLVAIYIVVIHRIYWNHKTISFVVSFSLNWKLFLCGIFLRTKFPVKIA